MRIIDLLSMCLKNLFRRKLRTLLTLFGVIIGTCSIVVMISLGVGLTETQLESIESMGDLTLITVYRNWENQENKLNQTAVSEIAAIPNVKVATPFVSYYSEFVIQVDERYRYQGSIVGVNRDALALLGYEAAEGRLFNSMDAKNAVVVGSKVAYQFMDTKKKRNNYVDPYPDEFGRIQDPFVDIMHDKVFLNITDNEAEDWLEIPTNKGSERLNVVGVLQSSSDNNYRFDKDYTIYMDINYALEMQKLYNKENKVRTSDDQNNYDTVYVKANSIDDVTAIEAAIQDMGFNTDSLNSMREETQNQFRTIQLILGGLGAISLLVAALGITNTMIMSIYERTREIGVMKVIGCSTGNIRTMFLMEAGFIGFFGGVLGIGISYGLSYLINMVLNNMNGGGSMMGGGIMVGGYYGGMMDPSMMTQYSVIPPWLVGLALFFSTMIGLISGYYPANRAVKISALEAIKHD